MASEWIPSGQSAQKLFLTGKDARIRQGFFHKFSLRNLAHLAVPNLGFGYAESGFTH